MTQPFADPPLFASFPHRPVRHPFRRRWHALMIGLALLMAAPAPGAEAFVPGLDGVPLMPGLAPLAETVVAFDKPEGRIVESQAAAPGLAPAAVRGWYALALPQLGWSTGTDGRFARAGERLELDVIGQAEDIRVRFRLVPSEPADGRAREE